MRSKWFTVGIAISLSAATFAKSLSTKMDQPWDSNDDPANFGMDLDYRIGDLATGGWASSAISQGEVTRKPWSGHWWPAAQGSAAIRPTDRTDIWGLNAPAFSNHHYTVDELIEHTNYVGKSGNVQGDVDLYEGGLLDDLAPTEKFDVTLGHADPNKSDFYQNTEAVLSFARKNISPETLKWAGLCNGWASASIYTPEPKAVQRYSAVYTLQNGKKIQFRTKLYSGDLKGIATYEYAMRTWSLGDGNFIGISGPECDEKTGAGCRSINAGSFHILLTNVVGRRHQAFFVDRDPSEEVWNYPIYGYRIQQVGGRNYYNSDGSKTRYWRADAATSATHELRVVVDVDYMNETQPMRYPLMADGLKESQTFKYEYVVELTDGKDGKPFTADDVVVGGAWLSDDHPDAAWILKHPYRFTDKDFYLVDPQNSDTAWIPAWQVDEWKAYWSTLKNAK